MLSDEHYKELAAIIKEELIGDNETLWFCEIQGPIPFVDSLAFWIATRVDPNFDWEKFKKECGAN